MLFRLTMLCGMTLLAVGCATTTASVGTECSVWKPITWSVKDTDQTIAEVKTNNARQKAWCKKGGLW